jgi:hypothetical protein
MIAMNNAHLLDGVPVDESKIKVVLDHWRDVMVGGDLRRYEYVMDWLAWVVQRPHEKTGILLHFVGPRNAGTSAAVDHFGTQILGRADTVTIANFDQQNIRWARKPEKLLTIWSQPPWDDVDIGELRSMVTFRGDLLIDGLAKNPRVVKSLGNHIVTSNRCPSAPLPWVMAIHSSNCKVGNKEYFERLFRALGDPDVNRDLKAWFQRRPIGDWTPAIPDPNSRASH